MPRVVFCRALKPLRLSNAYPSPRYRVSPRLTVLPAMPSEIPKDIEGSTEPNAGFDVIIKAKPVLERSTTSQRYHPAAWLPARREQRGPTSSAEPASLTLRGSTPLLPYSFTSGVTHCQHFRWLLPFREPLGRSPLLLAIYASIALMIVKSSSISPCGDAR